MGLKTPPVRPLNRTSLLFLFQNAESDAKRGLTEQSANSDLFPLIPTEDSKQEYQYATGN
jgi:hypothetical protein